MIVFEDKTFSMNSMFPNSNWTDNDVFVIGDGSELAKKVKANSPHFDFVLSGENLIDIVPTDRPSEPTPEPAEIDLLGQQLVEKELQILELQQENQILGQQLVEIDLRLLIGGL